MGISKRESIAKPVARKTKPRRMVRYEDESDGPSEEQNNDSGSEPEEEEEEEEVDWDSDADIPTAAPRAVPDLATVSFGDLAKAQRALDKHKRREQKRTGRTEAPQIFAREPPPRGPSKGPSKAEIVRRFIKHAPQEITSKRPVSRKRDFALDNKPAPRDPRFDPLAGDVNETLIRKAYGFLGEYRAKEITELKAQIRKAQSENEKERLKRELLVLESKKKAEDRKDRQQAVIDEHKRKEKELVAQGKTPYYLKKAELKQKVLVNQFESMSKKQVDKAIMRKRKKVAGKEKKELAFLDGRVGAGERQAYSGSGGFKKRW